jgi:hypothetical protein
LGIFIPIRPYFAALIMWYVFVYMVLKRKHMKNADTNKQEKKFPVREGSGDSSILHDKKPIAKDAYPRPEKKDKQAKNQSEFTEEQPNRKSPNSPE